MYIYAYVLKVIFLKVVMVLIFASVLYYEQLPRHPYARMDPHVLRRLWEH